ncbi:MAG: hypothetical protein CL840_03630 [Crocinitomicaceae bacterium]|jgi:hypothetical protein|nr:hypothetical protein [Crocinitomicaceae bacterium]|tara:strand:- start:1532 stop:1930 length:399 start_codon:yes stop_codon:yes gene_type:complete
MIDKFQALKNDRVVISVIFYCIAAAALFFSYMYYTEPRFEPDFEFQRSKDVGQCANFAKHKGFEAKKPEKHIVEISSFNFDDPKFTFATVESVILACDNLELTSFCMGTADECMLPENGLRMVLAYKQPKAK